MSSSKHLSKRQRLKYKKRKETWDKRCKTALTEANKNKKSLKNIATALYNKETFHTRLRPEWQYLSHIFDLLNGRRFVSARRVFLDIILFLDQQGCERLLKEKEYLHAIYQVARHRTWIIRPFNEWTKKSHNPHKQFISFIRHCFVKYEMPIFMNTAWYEDGSLRFIDWFIDIGRGMNLRKCKNLPIDMTKKISHYFMQAPDDFNVAEAMRWAQVLGMGGDETLANNIVSSILGRNNFNDEEFWKKVILYLIQNASMLAKNKLQEVVDYISSIYTDRGEFNIKDRNINNLIRLSDEWHVATSFTRTLGNVKSWEECGVQEYRVEEGEEEERKIYFIVELLSAKALADEGRKMRHCVGSYAFYCSKKRCSIFSLRVMEASGEQKRLGTLEISLPSKTIVQAKAKCNAKMTDKARKIMNAWATQEDLKLSRWL